ncbi:enoyl-CoA hydratase/carnithine racemase [Panacagrimonas perspica]|uniref:Enoyl-CoA hydratase/carnithine racemase n=1 Tax=Panacagrimonas perspica TaxID=381431 RepID=A0A4R7P6I7_9GAMM|nr:enoyl-CoA hydratase/isomerase family protein [Panacagrimonas perspica]TDU28901.1 enoyl-CoA hydratase/carnithine racemase [Panacagrimonas perspica]THD02274.1 enoyl-CoA hydratase [Panacagrimonas perspica]
MSVEGVLERQMRGAVAELKMVYRPHNLLGPALLDAIVSELDAARREGAKAVVIRSGLRHFSAGAEIELFDAMVENKGEGKLGIDCVGFLRALETYPLPIVASIHGICVGGGFELALACDYILCSANSKIGSVEATLGLHPLMGAIQRVTQRAGALRAKEMSILARRYDPATLERWGLINQVVADEHLEAKTFEIAEELAAGPTIAHTATKHLTRIACDQGVAAADDAMAEIQKPIWASRDLKTGLSAYRSSGGPTKAVFAGN